MPADRPARPTRVLALRDDVTLRITAHEGGAVTVVAGRGPLAYTLELNPMQARLLAASVFPDRFKPGDMAWWNGEWVEVRNGPYVGWGVETMGTGRPSTASDAQLMTRARRERIQAAAAEQAAADRAAAAAVEQVAAADAD